MSSPTGNIWCSLQSDLTCFIFESDYAPLPAEDCEAGDWGDHIFFTRDTTGARGRCQSDTPFGGEPPALPYGSTAVASGFACQSTTSGMTCWNTMTGHGFRISRESYDLF